MNIRRYEDNNGVQLTVELDPNDIGHKIHCAHEDIDWDGSVTGHKAPAVLISLVSRGSVKSVADVLAYANEVAAVAGVAAALQEEMTRRYHEKYGK